MTMVSFDDLEGTLNEGGSRAAPKAGTEWTNPCAKCRGSGRFISTHGRDVGPCYLCKGSGKLTFKTSPEHRAKAKASKVAGKVAAAQSWRDAHAAEYQWCIEASARGFRFAGEMIVAVGQYGSLTDGQLAAVQRFMAGDAARATVRAETKETAKGIDVSRIAELFATARGNALKKPVLRVGEIELALASERGKNPGAVYVRRPADDTYLGKIVGGIYEPSFKATASDLETVKATAVNPLELAVAYGRRTGSCSCCGRTLSNKLSIELGIGPICRSKWGM